MINFGCRRRRHTTRGLLVCEGEPRADFRSLILTTSSCCYVGLLLGLLVKLAQLLDDRGWDKVQHQKGVVG